MILYSPSGNPSTVDNDQVAILLSAGWSKEKPKPKVEPPTKLESGKSSPPKSVSK